MDTIAITDLRVPVRVGVSDAERERVQPVVVAIEIGADLARAGGSDDLGDTVDYGAVASAVASALRDRPARLLEHLAERAVRAAGAFPGVLRVAVEVAKEQPPLTEDVSSVAVRIEREVHS